MITISVKNKLGESAVVNLKTIDSFFDCATDFNIDITQDQIKTILEENPEIAFDCYLFGDDTEVGDRFFLTFVKKVTEESLSVIQEKYKERSYEYVTVKALAKGYKLHKSNS